MTVNRPAGILTIITATLALLSMASAGVIWVGDSRWVTHDSLNQSVKHIRLGLINDRINELETKIRFNEASRSDEVQYKYYLHRREEILTAGR